MYAAMDIGTNSCRLLLASVNTLGEIKIEEQHLRTTRIGAGMGTERLLKPDAIERTLSALEEFAEIIGRYRVQQLVLVATQAVRSAENQNRLVQAVKDRLNWDLQIISGEREAWLSYWGATSDLKEKPNPLVIDIGGGSTEFIGLNSEKQVSVLSIPLGALKLLENPLSDKELARVVTEALQVFKSKEDSPSYTLVGVGGTCTTLAAVDLGLREYDREKVQGHRIDGSRIKDIYEMLAALTVPERLKLAGIYPGREDLIIPGLQILLAIVKYFNSNSVLISDRDLLWALVDEMVKQEV